MRMVDLIMKKREGKALTKEEIAFLVQGYVKGEIPDYQVSAFLMAVCFQGMTEEETFALTHEITISGDVVDLSPIEGVKVDKHSTGGVGDKTTLIAAPLAAACGVKIAKMSGRGLGHTGGTVDKLEAIPGMKMNLNREDFFQAVRDTGLAVIGQSGNLTPADKKLYALRDVTATVESIPLIASSIMGKKLAAGSDGIVLDVKTGSGAFMKTKEDAKALALEMVKIGENAGKRMVALITNMDVPLGNAIGNSLEVIEAVQVLQGNGPEDLTYVATELAANMVYLAGKGTLEACRKQVKEAIDNGTGLERLAAMVSAQGGQAEVIRDTALFEKAPLEKNILAKESGYLISMDTEQIGRASCILGAGREKKEDPIDYSAGIYIHKKTGQYVNAGEVLAVLYTSKEETFAEAETCYLEGLVFSEKQPEESPLIYERIALEKDDK